MTFSELEQETEPSEPHRHSTERLLKKRGMGQDIDLEKFEAEREFLRKARTQKNGHFGLHRRASMTLGQLPDFEQARVMQRLAAPRESSAERVARANRDAYRRRGDALLDLRVR